MKRFATILMTLGALGASACGGAAPDVMGPQGEQTAPLWMAEQDLPGCEATQAPAQPTSLQALAHPYDAALAIVVEDGAPRCIDTREVVLEAFKSGWTPPAWRGMAGSSIAPPMDDPVPIKGTEEDPGSQEEAGGSSSGSTSGSTTSSGKGGLPAVVVLDRGDMIKDDPVPIKGGKQIAVTDK